VIVAPSGSPGALAAKATTTTIPIVFVVGSDPVKMGLVASLNRPGDNLTGVTSLDADLAPKPAGAAARADADGDHYCVPGQSDQSSH
jgi:hypothetical protein